MKRSLLPMLFLILAACQEAPQQEVTEVVAVPPPPRALAEVLAAQPEETRARYPYRHPQETLEFFGIEPGMTVLEGLPGAGWYTKILLQFLGEDGLVVAADYPMDMWPHFAFGTEEFIAKRADWPTDFLQNMAEWSGETGAEAKTFVFGSMPDDLAGTVDVVFFPRVLHNLAYHDDKGGYLSLALNDAYMALKPGGVFGVVQHEARDAMPDDWADGGSGYLKKAFVIEQAEKAGFEFVADSDINANDKDQPTVDDVVWRLPPTLRGSRDDPEQKAAMEAIGESNRMTLKFKKPE
ncbi:MAG: methyltransferase [Gammaproteobacteria bacterium]|nr:methyltransferase [Gammaproteobacteria bacterium]MDH3410242.1 methyltransferase [Gammaproteobacteria bacterium]